MSALNSREEKLLDVQRLSFMIVEMNLYLNTHPRSQEALCMLKKYIALEKTARREYEQAYGPLTIAAVADSCRYDWINRPWPWEMEA